MASRRDTIRPSRPTPRLQRPKASHRPTLALFRREVVIPSTSRRFCVSPSALAAESRPPHPNEAAPGRRRRASCGAATTAAPASTAWALEAPEASGGRGAPSGAKEVTAASIFGFHASEDALQGGETRPGNSTSVQNEFSPRLAAPRLASPRLADGVGGRARLAPWRDAEATRTTPCRAMTGRSRSAPPRGTALQARRSGLSRCDR